MESRSLPCSQSCWSQQHTGTEQGMVLPSFLTKRDLWRLKSSASSQVLLLGFRMVSVQSSASRRDSLWDSIQLELGWYPVWTGTLP